MRREGFQLVEVILAIVLAAGPIATAVQLVHSGHRQICISTEQAQARILLDDLVLILEDAPKEELRAMAAGNSDRLQSVGASRLERMSPELEKISRVQLEPLLEKLKLVLVEDAGGVPGLAVLTLSTVTPAGTPVEVRQVMRMQDPPSR